MHHLEAATASVQTAIEGSGGNEAPSLENLARTGPALGKVRCFPR